MKKLALALCLSLFAAGMLLGCPPAATNNAGNVTDNNNAAENNDAGEGNNEAGETNNDAAENNDG